MGTCSNKANTITGITKERALEAIKSNIDLVTKKIAKTDITAHVIKKNRTLSPDGETVFVISTFLWGKITLGSKQIRRKGMYMKPDNNKAAARMKQITATKIM